MSWVPRFVLLQFVLLCSYTAIECKRPNVCINAEDYMSMDGNRKCYYEEDFELNVPELIKKYTGTFEAHEIITEDGYILTMFRIHREDRKGVFLLQHAMFTNSLSYLLQGEDSIAFYLWRNGYEVWLNNQRGTFFSNRHVNLTASQPEYWDFSFHEIGYYDVDAQIRYMRENTNDSKIFFYGYSLGTTDGLVYASMRSRNAEQAVEAFIYVGLTCYYAYNQSLATIVAKFVGIFRDLFGFLHIETGAIPLLRTVHALHYFLSKRIPALLVLAYIFELFATGYTPGEFDPRLISTDFARLADNISVRTLLHLLQLMNSKDQFEMYDYGKAKNRLIYGSDRPLLYPIENITVPTLIVYSEEDILTTKRDSLLLYDRLNPKAKTYGTLEVKGLNHEDFNFGKHRKVNLLDRMLDLISKGNI